MPTGGEGGDRSPPHEPGYSPEALPCLFLAPDSPRHSAPTLDLTSRRNTKDNRRLQGSVVVAGLSTLGTPKGHAEGRGDRPMSQLAPANPNLALMDPGRAMHPTASGEEPRRVKAFNSI